MSCNGKNKQCAAAAGRNGVWCVANKYLGTLGSLSSYQDLNSLEQVPGRVDQITAAFFGLAGLGNLTQGRWPRFIGRAAMVGLAIHAAEQATANVATAAIRSGLKRGQPVAKYRNVIIREQPQPPAARGDVLAAKGYYFHEGGRTWRAESVTWNVNGSPRTLTRVKSYSLPYREHYFDRPLTLGGDTEVGQLGDDREARTLYIQRVIDVVKGDEAAAAVPGHIGSTNELENITPLGDIKRAFVMANWYLVDESERDDPAANREVLNYGNMLTGVDSTRENEPGYYQLKPASSPATAKPAAGGGGSNPYRQQVETLAQAATIPTARSPVAAEPAAKAAEAPGIAQARIVPSGNHWRMTDGQTCPVRTCPGRT